MSDPVDAPALNSDKSPLLFASDNNLEYRKQAALTASGRERGHCGMAP